MMNENNNKPKFKQTEIGKIPEDWEVKKVKDVAIVNERNINNSFKYEEIEYIDISSVDKGKIIETRQLTLNKAPSRAKRIIRDNDIIISTVRPNLKHFAFIKKAKPNTVVSTGFAVISPKKIVPRFLYYYLTTDYYTNYLAAIADTHTSAYPAFNPDVIEESYIPFPHSFEQKAIARILSSLDDKIELNHRMNKTLEAIAQAIFKHWFVDFEFPNEEGKPYKSSGGEMEYNEELGKEIPKGWEVGELGEYGSFRNGINYSREEKGDAEFSIVNVRNLVYTDFISKDNVDSIIIDSQKAEKYLLENKDILIARSASPGETALVLEEQSNTIFSGFTIRYRLNNLDNYLFFFFILRQIRDKLIYISDGTTLKNITQETLKKIRITVPDEKTIAEFNKIIESILNKMYRNLKENWYLSQIRDVLLPKLMSGEIRVKVDAVEENV